MVRNMQVLPEYEKFCQGDQAAFQAITENFAKALSRYAYKTVRRWDIAEDVMMDALMELVVKKRKFASEEHLTAFLYRITRNKSLDALRKRKRMVPLTEAETLLTHEREESSEAYQDAMARLPKNYREVLELTYEEGLRVEEIAFVLKKSRKQIYNILFRAKNSFQKIYGEVK